jgi:hypothetical protein
MLALTTAASASRSTAADATAAATRSTSHRCAPRPEDDVEGRNDSPQRRGNPLVSAMMSALGALMPTGSADATRSETLKDSAEAFAHELFDALRGNGGRGRAHGHGHHRHGGERGYGDLAQRLDRLARQVDAPAATAATGTTTISASLVTALFSASVDGESAGAELSVTTLQIDITQQTTTAPAASAESPLQAAFRRLFDALQPAGSPSTPASEPAGSASASGTGGLSAFLRQLADALRNGSGADDHTTGPSTGGLLSLAA